MVCACAGEARRSPPTAAPAATPIAPPTATAVASSTPSPSPGPVVLVGAGDIASCALPGDEQTAALLDGIPGTIFTAGDNAYESGTIAEFQNCYGPTWGRHRARTHPSIGSHEYNTANAEGYFAYFGEAAGPRGRAYYSYDLGPWHIVVLNSNCGIVACASGSPQERWLREDVAVSGGRCILAMWHHPRFSSGEHGDDAATRPFWAALQTAGADVVIVGHDHHYERFAPQDEDARPDPTRGLREFVVGTGGASLRSTPRRAANTEFMRTGIWGVLRLTLYADRYDWEFIAITGATIDSGVARCRRGR